MNMYVRILSYTQIHASYLILSPLFLPSQSPFSFTFFKKSKINLKASEWHIRKDSTPPTGGFLELTTNGMEIVVPLSDEDLHNILAIKLSKEVPLYF